jgi:hypothetical protein
MPFQVEQFKLRHAKLALLNIKYNIFNLSSFTKKNMRSSSFLKPKGVIHNKNEIVLRLGSLYSPVMLLGAKVAKHFAGGWPASQRIE